jgi:GPH family glycoside/pentoside/hexuronide:cation symporter
MEQNNQLTPNSGYKISITDKVAYGSGAIGDTLLYDYIFAYMLLFMTDYAGVAPGIAGTVLLIATLWDCITDPMVGHISDNSRNPNGRRVPFMMKSIIPLFVVTCLCFVKVDFGTAGTAIYYTIMCAAFWTVFTFIQTPYFSFLPEMTIHESERTSIRAWSVGVGAVGTIALSAVYTILNGCQNAGLSDGLSWQVVTLFCLVVSSLGYVFCIARTKKYDIAATKLVLDKPKVQGNLMANVFKNIAYVVKTKGYLFAFFAYFANLLAYITILSLIAYVGKHALGLPAAQISMATLVYTFSRVAWLPVVKYLATKFGRRNMLAVTLIIGGFIIASLAVLGMNSLSTLVFMGFVVGFLGATYYTLVFTLLYDLLDLNYLRTDKKEEGKFMSVFLFMGKLGGAFAGVVVGWLLQGIGYDAALAEQTAETVRGLSIIYTAVPGGIYFITGLVVLAFPITKKISEAMLAAIALKEDGKAYSTDGFEHLLK